MPKLNPDDIIKRLESLMGYGKPRKGQIWFLGLEEGRGTSFKELEIRMKQPAFDDNYLSH